MGAPVAQVVSSHRALKKAIKITHLGINMIVITWNFTNLKKIPSFTEIIIKVRQSKTSLNVCGPYKYRINTINKKHLNIPRCRINPKKVRLENTISWVLLKGLGPWSSQPLDLGMGRSGCGLVENN